MSTTTALAKIEEVHTPAPVWSKEKIDLVKRTIAKGATDDELELFIHQCQRTGLDPFSRQIYAVKRWDAREQREVMTIQTGIDGYRLVAERTRRYAPGRKHSFTYDESGKLISATAYVKKLTDDGTWHEVEAEAFFAEYAQTTKNGSLTPLWQRMPHVMLGKCSEAQALRRAFPAELSGIYTDDEMGRSTEEDHELQASPAAVGNRQQRNGPTKGQIQQSQLLLDQFRKRYQEAKYKPDVKAIGKEITSVKPQILPADLDALRRLHEEALAARPEAPAPALVGTAQSVNQAGNRQPGDDDDAPPPEDD